MKVRKLLEHNVYAFENITIYEEKRLKCINSNTISAKCPQIREYAWFYR